MADDIFGLKPGWIERFAAVVEARGSRVPFKCLLRADGVDRDGGPGAARRRAAGRPGSARSRDRSAFSTRWRRASASIRSPSATRLLRAAGIEVGVLPAVRLSRRDARWTFSARCRWCGLRAGRHRRVGVLSAAGHALLRTRQGAARPEAELGRLRRSRDDVSLDLPAGVLPGAASSRARRVPRAAGVAAAAHRWPGRPATCSYQDWRASWPPACPRCCGCRGSGAASIGWPATRPPDAPPALLPVLSRQAASAPSEQPR